MQIAALFMTKSMVSACGESDNKAYIPIKIAYVSSAID